jgi:uncharacterized peroxidase-related enzyme
VPHFPALAEPQAPPGSRTTLAALRERFGRVPNVYATAAGSSAVLTGLVDYADAVERHSGLDRRTREAVALAVSEINRCECCVAAHAMLGRYAGWSQEELAAVRRGGSAYSTMLDHKLTVLLELAAAVVAGRGEVDGEVVSAARAAGWSDAELLDTFATVMEAMLTNYFNRFARTEVDFPPAGGLG